MTPVLRPASADLDKLTSSVDQFAQFERDQALPDELLEIARPIELQPRQERPECGRNTTLQHRQGNCARLARRGSGALAQASQRLRQYHFLASEVRAERILGKKTRASMRGQPPLESGRRVIAATLRDPVVARQLAGGLRLAQEAFLEARVRDVDQGRDDLAVFP